MTHDPHGLDRLLALAGVVARGDVPAPELADSFGDAVDTFGSGEHWRVAAPNAPGVHGRVFLVRNGDPAVSPVVDLVIAHYARGAGPTLRAVEARFGPSEHIPPARLAATPRLHQGSRRAGRPRRRVRHHGRGAGPRPGRPSDGDLAAARTGLTGRVP